MPNVGYHQLNPKWAFTVPEDVLAPNGARPPAGTMFVKQFFIHPIALMTTSVATGDDNVGIMTTLISHYSDVISAMASQIASLTIVYSIVYSGADQRKHQSSASLAFVRGIHRWPVNSPHKWPVLLKMFPFNGVIMVFDATVTLSIVITWLFASISTKIARPSERHWLDIDQTLLQLIDVHSMSIRGSLLSGKDGSDTFQPGLHPLTNLATLKIANHTSPRN